MPDRLSLVTGATGVIGPTLVRALLDRGERVRALVRRELAPGELPGETEVVVGDIADADALRRAVEGVDNVFHLAAKLHINNPDAAMEEEYWRTNVEGTRLLLQAASAANVRRVVFFSSICVYGASRPGQIFDEGSPVSRDTLYSKTKAEAEHLVLDAKRGDTGGPIGVVLRLPAVYGSHMKGNYPRLVRALKRGRFRHIGTGANRRTLIHEQDVVAAALVAAEHEAAPGRVFNATDGTVHTMNEIVAAICQALNVKPPRLNIPEAPVRLMAGAVERAFRVAGRRAPIDRATVDKLMEDVAVSGELMSSELGFQPRIGLAEGWREAVTANNK